MTNNVASPYLDYDANQLFFGDSAGRIHRVVNVDTPAAARDTTAFPVLCGTAQLQSPVFWNGQIVTSSADGRVYRIDTTTGPPYSCLGSLQGGAGLAGGTGGGVSAPVLDVTNDKIIVASNNSTGGMGRAIAAFNLMFAAGEVPSSFASDRADCDHDPSSWSILRRHVLVDQQLATCMWPGPTMPEPGPT